MSDPSIDALLSENALLAERVFDLTRRNEEWQRRAAESWEALLECARAMPGGPGGYTVGELDGPADVAARVVECIQGLVWVSEEFERMKKVVGFDHWGRGSVPLTGTEFMALFLATPVRLAPGTAKGWGEGGSMSDVDEIRAWLKKQEGAADYIGPWGSCQYDHAGADRHILALLEENERLVARATNLECRNESHVETMTGVAVGLRTATTIIMDRSWTLEEVCEVLDTHATELDRIAAIAAAKATP